MMPPDLPPYRSQTYAGIGSRATPPDDLVLICDLATWLAKQRLTLRSGGAPGADSAFEAGCDQAGGKKQIFLPWRGFNRSRSPFYTPPPKAYRLAGQLHPRWDRCKPADRNFHARNCQQILGLNLDDPVDFVFFWAPEANDRVMGGTATAVRLAREFGIPVFNLWRPHIRAYWADLVTR